MKQVTTQGGTELGWPSEVVECRFLWEHRRGCRTDTLLDEMEDQFSSDCLAMVPSSSTLASLVRYVVGAPEKQPKHPRFRF